MGSAPVRRREDLFPSLFEDFFKPWNSGWLGKAWDRDLTVPAVNISETKDNFKVSMAAPGMKKDDFKIDVEGNMLSISAETEEQKEEKDAKFTRQEYNYSSFSRSFTLPEGVNQDKIEAKYEDGVLKLVLPKNEAAKKVAAKHISVK
ncbi:Hsp20/alpha crystallin family protein [Solitalea lacus]|uniref:Hsp20/alpha crystallin family protein n=1 Tax=Solitalea lacus TaxID=2911172 RepID=UPI001EDB8470|nr:Hsp20/alpha crystallin family protein [Solitalea lacus]UKJ06719.1 Hsp20/alpha crystallin family protein [Solitalea lacus]